MITAVFVMAFCLMCVSCGFQLRSATALPVELNHIYFSTDKPYSSLATQLKLLLQQPFNRLVKKQSGARFSVVVSNDIYSYSRPDVVNASLPTTLNFLQTATISINDNITHKTIASQVFRTGQSLTLNANQIYTADNSDFIRQELVHTMVSLIYFWLISSNTQDALHHAITPKAAVSH